MLHLGNIPASTTLYIPFNTFDANGASVTISGLAVTDIEIYKNGSTTQRSSDNGYTLLDTDGIDFDGITGIHGFSVNLSDNSDAGFYAAGSTYWVVVSSITANGQTVNFIAATFRIVAAEGTAGTPVADATRINNIAATSVTTINANIGSTQPLNFTGTGASALLKGDVVDIAGAAVSTSIAQIGVNAVNIGGTAQTGRDIGASVLLSSGTGTGQLDFTSGVTKANVTQYNGVAATSASGRPEVNTSHIAGSAVSAAAAQIGVNVVNFGGSAGTFSAGRPEVNTTHAAGTAWGSGAITSGSIAAGAFTAAKFAANALDAVWSTAARLLTAGTNIVLAKGVGVTGFNDPTAIENADALLDRANAIETGLTPRNALKLIAAADAGKLSGAGTGTEVIRNAVADSKDRITATVDASGNRTAITTDLS